jgi:hypothetical protein
MWFFSSYSSTAVLLALAIWRIYRIERYFRAPFLTPYSPEAVGTLRDVPNSQHGQPEGCEYPDCIANGDAQTTDNPVRYVPSKPIRKPLVIGTHLREAEGTMPRGTRTVDRLRLLDVSVF